MEFCSNWLRMITLCENIIHFLSCGPDCLYLYNMTELNIYLNNAILIIVGCAHSVVHRGYNIQLNQTFPTQINNV